MNVRFLLICLLCALVAVGASVSSLTWLDQHLDVPAIHYFDLSLQAHVHADTAPRLLPAMLAFTWLGSIRIFFSSLVAVLIVMALRKRWHAAIVLTVSMLGALVLNETLKQHFHRARPQMPWSIGDEHTFSFPSGHSLFSVVLYGTLAYLALPHAASLKRRFAILIPAVLLPLCIGISRIALGMHYPTDVLAGFLVGAFWLTAVIAANTSAPAPHPAEILSGIRLR